MGDAFKMILRIEEIQEAASKVLKAVDANSLSTLTETLELSTEGNNLVLAITNREYFVRIKIAVGEVEEFKATVNANVFLKLIAQTTTDTIQLTLKDTYMEFKGNGTYKLPLIFDGDKLLDLPEITIQNETVAFDISNSTLDTIAKYNSKELLKGVFADPVQRLYYVDDKGCITFTTGACINSFSLPQKVRFLLNDRIVRLFKLFKSDMVHFALGYDMGSNGVIQTKVKFEADGVCITAILICDDTMLDSVPIDLLRETAEDIYPYSITVNKDELSRCLSRLLLFANKNDLSLKSKFEFGADMVKVWDTKGENFESLYYSNSLSNLTEPYVATLDITELKTTVDSCFEPNLVIRFGNESALVLVSRPNILNVIPEIVCQETEENSSRIN